MTSDQTGPAGAPAVGIMDLTILRDNHAQCLAAPDCGDDPHCRAGCQSGDGDTFPCRTSRLLDAYEEVVEAFAATPALLESVARTGMAAVQEAWDARDAQRARADAAEAKLVGLGACYDDLVTDGRALVEENNELEADRDRERARADAAEASIQNAIDLMVHGCHKPEHHGMPWDAFVSNGGLSCPFCLKADRDRERQRAEGLAAACEVVLMYPECYTGMASEVYDQIRAALSGDGGEHVG